MTIKPAAAGSHTSSRATANSRIENPLLIEGIGKEVTLFPCGHILPEDFAIQCLARDRLCPIDGRKIEKTDEFLRNFNENISQSQKFPFLSVASATAVSPVFQVKRDIPEIAFGKVEWEKYVGDIGIEPPLPPDIHQILQSPCPFVPGKKVEETHLLTLIPTTVNKKPLTLNYLEKLVQQPRQGPAIRYFEYGDSIKEEYGETSIQSSYWTLLTKDPIFESRVKFYDAYSLEKLQQSCSQKSRDYYEIPRLLETVTSLCMEYVRSGKMMYSDNPKFTCTACQERLSKHPGRTLIVGGFNANGLMITDNTLNKMQVLGIGVSFKL